MFHLKGGCCAIILQPAIYYNSLISNNRMKNLLTRTETLGNKELFTSEFVITSDPHLVGSVKACEKPTKYEIYVEIKR
jgi:hypothetical protein